MIPILQMVKLRLKKVKLPKVTLQASEPSLPSTRVYTYCILSSSLRSNPGWLQEAGSVLSSSHHCPRHWEHTVTTQVGDNGVANKGKVTKAKK